RALVRRVRENRHELDVYTRFKKARQISMAPAAALDPVPPFPGRSPQGVAVPVHDHGSTSWREIKNKPAAAVRSRLVSFLVGRSARPARGAYARRREAHRR